MIFRRAAESPECHRVRPVHFPVAEIFQSAEDLLSDRLNGRFPTAASTAEIGSRQS